MKRSTQLYVGIAHTLFIMLHAYIHGARRNKKKITLMLFFFRRRCRRHRCCCSHGEPRE